MNFPVWNRQVAVPKRFLETARNTIPAQRAPAGVANSTHCLAGPLLRETPLFRPVSGRVSAAQGAGQRTAALRLRSTAGFFHELRSPSVRPDSLPVSAGSNSAVQRPFPSFDAYHTSCNILLCVCITRHSWSFNVFACLGAVPRPCYV
jgi:hypothetical protein